MRALPTILLLLAPTLACTATRDVATPLTSETSVKPGINDNFLDPDLDVLEYVDRFEGESREISVNKDAIVRSIGLRPGMHVADVGAGTGLFLGSLTSAVGPRGKVYAVDISARFLEHIEERGQREGWRVEPVLCTERSTELPAASVDLAFVCDTYHHFEYPRSTLASLYSSIRPGGTLFVIDFERIPGVTREWLLEHVRAGKDVFRSEIEAAGFAFEEEVEVAGLEENYALRFRRP